MISPGHHLKMRHSCVPSCECHLKTPHRPLGQLAWRVLVFASVGGANNVPAQSPQTQEDQMRGAGVAFVMEDIEVRFVKCLCHVRLQFLCFLFLYPSGPRCCSSNGTSLNPGVAVDVVVPTHSPGFVPARPGCQKPHCCCCCCCWSEPNSVQ